MNHPPTFRIKVPGKCPYMGERNNLFQELREKVIEENPGIQSFYMILECAGNHNFRKEWHRA